MQVVVMIFFER